MIDTDNDPVVVVGMARTPMGGLQGALSSLSAPELGASAISAALERSALQPNQVDELLMGCVLPAAVGQAPARQAALKAGLPQSVPCTTVSKVCGSGMKAIMQAHDAIKAGSANIVVAGGMESMSNAPYLLPKARSGYRFGHGELLDHMLYDGLQDAYSGGSMGTFAEQCADHFQFSRQQQDQYAIESLQRAVDANRAGHLDAELVPITISDRKGQQTISEDEQPGKASVDKIPALKPAFKKDGTVTAANSSSISDGAAALVLTRKSIAEKHSLPIIATLHHHSQFAADPSWFTTAPIYAINALLKKLQWDRSSVDLYEINEAFAVVAMAAMKELDIQREKVNIFGGACALGHPIGASGARIVVTLINALRVTQQTRGIASLCIGGGEATAVAVSI